MPTFRCTSQYGGSWISGAGPAHDLNGRALAPKVAFRHGGATFGPDAGRTRSQGEGHRVWTMSGLSCSKTEYPSPVGPAVRRHRQQHGLSPHQGHSGVVARAGSVGAGWEGGSLLRNSNRRMGPSTEAMRTSSIAASTPPAPNAGRSEGFHGRIETPERSTWSAVNPRGPIGPETTCLSCSHAERRPVRRGATSAR